MEQIATGISKVVVQNNILVIKINIEQVEGISSGVYLFDTMINGRKTFGKFILSNQH